MGVLEMSIQAKSITTLNEALSNRANWDREIILYNSTKEKETLSFKDLYNRALKKLSLLQAKGIHAGDTVILFLSNNQDLLEAFWACILGGIVPVPLPCGSSQEKINKLSSVARFIGNSVIITSNKYTQRLSNDESGLFQSSGIDIYELDLSTQVESAPVLHKSKPSDCAFIQFTSGSTGDPKGVVLSHENLITNMRAIAAGMKLQQHEVPLSWLPLTHDMGLIGFHLTPILFGISHHIMEASIFTRNPLFWLQTASMINANILSSPNFGFKYVLKALNWMPDIQLNLSSVRVIFNGAEAISGNTCREFEASLSKFGLSKHVIFPVYGQAEASLAVSFPVVNTPMDSIHVDRSQMMSNRHVSVCTQDDLSGIEIVCVGKAVAGCELRISNSNGDNIAEGIVGQVQIRGGNVTSGYYQNDQANEKLFTEDGWLNTGDLGFIYDSNLYISGRDKDIVIKNGCNYYLHDIDSICEVIPQLQFGNIASCCVPGKDQADAIVVYIQGIDEESESFSKLSAEIKSKVYKHALVDIHDIVGISKIPRTTSGKIKRFNLSQHYINRNTSTVS